MSRTSARSSPRATSRRTAPRRKTETHMPKNAATRSVSITGGGGRGAGRTETITSPPAPQVAEGSTMTHKQILVVFGSLMLGLLLASLDNTIVGTAIRTITGDIGGKDGLARIPWVTPAYVLPSPPATPIYGKLSDLFGRKPLYMTAIGLFLVGSFLSGFSQNLDELIAFRALQGLGAGGILGLTFAIVGDVVLPRERGKYQGLFGGV